LSFELSLAYSIKQFLAHSGRIHALSTRAGSSFPSDEESLREGGPRPCETVYLPSSCGGFLFSAELLDRLISAAELSLGGQVLVVDSLSGYFSALLLAEGIYVTTLERSERKFRRVKRTLEKMGIVQSNIHQTFVEGQESHISPYDRIFFMRPSMLVPDELLSKLAFGGQIFWFHEKCSETFAGGPDGQFPLIEVGVNRVKRTRDNNFEFEELFSEKLVRAN